jgi:hypothetical protein
MDTQSRWRLGACLAWVSTRDHKAVESTYEGADENITSKIWQPTVTPDPWGALKAKLCDGSLKLRGKETGAASEGVFPETPEAAKSYSVVQYDDGLRLVGRNPFPDICDVTGDRAEIIKLFPKKSNAGRKQIWDWEDARLFAYDALNKKGDFSAADQTDDWKSQAALEGAIKSYLGKRHPEGEEPSESLVRSHAKLFAASWREGRK